MKETKAEKSERYGDYAGAICCLGHRRGDRIFRRNFRVCLQPLNCPVAAPYRRALMEARGVLFNKLDLLKIKRETNPTIAAYVEAKRSKGDQRVLDAVVEKFARLSKGPDTQAAVAAALAAPARRTGGTTMTGGLHLRLLILHLPSSQYISLLLLPLGTEVRGSGQVFAHPLAPALIAMSKAITREMPAVRERSRDYIPFHLVLTCG
jgi:hypothetical protein